MATYKVIQDVEAEDKLVGPLTLRQFIYAAIAALLLYLSSFAVMKNAAYLLVFFVPPALLMVFLAIPWRGDQPTEVWALAKLRFFVKPRRRIWNQSGLRELVTITAPKYVERHLTKDFTQSEVRSRLQALANTIDSRGWAVKNVPVSAISMQQVTSPTSDRLLDASILPQEVSGVDIHDSDDILDATANRIAQHFDSMINSASSTQRQRLMSQIQAPSQPVPAQPVPAAATQWFMQPQQQTQTTAVSAPVIARNQQPPAQPSVSWQAAPSAATPTADEEALVEKFRSANQQQTIANDHLKRIKTPEELAAEQQRNMQAAASAKQGKAQVTSEEQAAIMNLAQNDDLDVATLARQANKTMKHDDGEVVISLR